MRPAISRRALLGLLGAGAPALPFLPLVEPRRAHAQAAAYPRRLVVMLGPLNGLEPGWVPAATGRGYAFTERLKPLEKFRDDLLVLSGLEGPNLVGFAEAHKHGVSGLWTGSAYQSRTGYAQNLSVDQAIAARAGGETPFRSLQFGVQTDLERVGAFVNMIYAGPNSPIAAVANPYVHFDRLFAGAGTATALPTDRLRLEKKSVLDEVSRSVARMQARVGAANRRKLDAHLEALRSIERRLDGSAGAQPAGTAAACKPPAFAGPQLDLGASANIPAIYRLQTDLMVAALACDRTRIASFQPVSSISTAVFTWCDVTTDFHFGTMHGRDAAARIRINDWFVRQFAYLLDALKAVPEGEGTLLDHTTVVWAGEFGMGNHDDIPTPFIIAGGRRAPGWKLGQHLAFPNGRWTRVLQALLRSYGIETPRFGELDDGMGPFPGLI